MPDAARPDARHCGTNGRSPAIAASCRRPPTPAHQPSRRQSGRSATAIATRPAQDPPSRGSPTTCGSSRSPRPAAKGTQGRSCTDGPAGAHCRPLPASHTAIATPISRDRSRAGHSTTPLFVPARTTTTGPTPRRNPTPDGPGDRAPEDHPGCSAGTRSASGLPSQDAIPVVCPCPSMPR